MAFFVWNKKMETGIESIDKQHKRLVELLAELHSAMVQGKGKEVLGGVLNSLMEYTSYHFNYEETLFGKFAFPGKDGHTAHHKGLVKEAQKLKDDYESGKVGLTINTMNFLKNWLNEHILKEDMEYVEFLQSKGVK